MIRSTCQRYGWRDARSLLEFSLRPSLSVDSIRNQFILVVVCAVVRPGEEATVAAVGKIENAVEIETAPPTYQPQ